MLKEKHQCDGEGMKKLRYLVTGGTGFLGQYVLRSLDAGAEVDVLSRSGKTGLKGDLGRWLAGLDIEALQSKNYDVLLHLAGLYDLSASASDVYMHNVAGTNVALQIAKALKIPVFVNASSIAAASNQKVDVSSAYDLSFSDPFPDPYSESKALAEQLVRSHLSGIPLTVNLRLGILVGDSEAGAISRLDGPYEVAFKIAKLKTLIQNWRWPLPVPGNPEVRLPLVPVDQAADAIVKISQWAAGLGELGYKSFNIVPRDGVSVRDLYQSTFEHLGLGQIKFKFISQGPKPLLSKVSSLALNLPEGQIRYALSLPAYESDTTRDILGGSWCSEFNDYEKTFWRGYEKYISNR
jgi:nucleoside-diphosphate-sugar epimerase